MAVDNTGSSYDGRIYVVWVDASFGNNTIRFAYSTNHGQSFTVLSQPLAVVPSSPPLIYDPEVTNSTAPSSFAQGPHTSYRF